MTSYAVTLTIDSGGGLTSSNDNYATVTGGDVKFCMSPRSVGDVYYLTMVREVVANDSQDAPNISGSPATQTLTHSLTFTNSITKSAGNQSIKLKKLGLHMTSVIVVEPSMVFQPPT